MFRLTLLLRFQVVGLLFGLVEARELVRGGQNFEQCAALLGTNSTTLGVCQATCPGWQIAALSEVDIWALPLFGFILPAVVFGMIVPRKRTLRVPDKLFDIWTTPWLRFCWYILIGAFSFLVAVIDSVCWVFAIFAFAGPMLVGALEELVLDFKILHHPYDHKQLENCLKLLATVIVGNIEVSDGIAQRIFDGILSDPASTFSTARPLNTSLAKKRLPNMLSAQMEFSDVVGGPVLFYVITFAYALNDGSINRTDMSVSIAIAFGMWWMSLVHVSMVSGCLLASNNHSTLRSVLGNDFPEDIQHELQPDKQAQSASKKALLQWFPLSYSKTFPSAWLWNRGHTKRQWISRVPEFCDVIIVSSFEYFLIGIAAFFLIIIPSILGLIVAYQTPEIGFSCRSIVILLYTCSQVVLVVYYAFHSYWISHGTVDDDEEIKYHQHGKFRKWFLCSQSAFVHHTLHTLFVAVLMISIITCVAGTLLEVMGVFRNCLCLATVNDWFNPNAQILLNPLASLVSQKSHQWWAPTGWSAIGFMLVVCVSGWWYQLVLRLRFEKRVEEIGVIYGQRRSVTV
jgi:hypothetical protein